MSEISRKIGALPVPPGMAAGLPAQAARPVEFGSVGVRGSTVPERQAPLRQAAHAQRRARRQGFIGRHATAWGAYALIGLLALLGVLPSARLLWEAGAGLAAGGNGALVRVLSEPGTWQALWNSFYTGVLGTVIAVVLGAGFAWAVVLTDIRRKSCWVFLFMLPMMIPPQVTALAWLQLFGPSSVLLQTLGLAPAMGSPQPLYSAEGIALLLGVQHAPLVFLALRASLLTLPGDLCEAARLAGASQAQMLRSIIVPLARPGLVAGAAMAFVSSLGNFGIPAMLGIPAGYYVLPTLIYQKMASFGPTMLQQVAALSLLVGVLAVAGVWLQGRLQARASYRLIGAGRRMAALPLGRARRWVEAGMAAVLLLILLAPLGALVAASLVPAMGVPLSWDTLTITAYIEMLTRQGATWRAVWNSCLLAGGAALVLMVLSLPLAWLMARQPGRWSRWLESILEIPYALPGTVLAVSCILLFARPLPWVGISLYGTLGIIFFAYMARFFTVALKPVQAGMRQLDPALEEAARLAGAGPLRRLRDMVLPLLAPSAFAGALLVFLTAVNELTVSALLWSAGTETLGVLIFNFSESGDNVLASAVSVAIVAGVALLMALLALFGGRLPQGVIPWRN